MKSVPESVMLALWRICQCKHKYLEYQQQVQPATRWCPLHHNICKKPEHKICQRAERGRKDGSESREKPRRRVREPEKPQGRVRREKAAAAATADRPTNRQVDMHVCRQSEKEQVNEGENVW